ncbi:hypothetical protein ScPMuIL_001962 [Solemya velum]
MSSEKKSKDLKDKYEKKQKAVEYYKENGVPQKMEAVLNLMFHEDPSDVYGYLANYFGQFSKSATFTKARARLALDGKGQPAVQTDLYGMCRNREQVLCTSVNSNQNPGVLENAKIEEKEADDQERLKCLNACIELINNDMSNRLQGVELCDQGKVDKVISDLVSDLMAEELAKQPEEEAEKGTEGDGLNPKEDPRSDSAKKPKSAKSKGKSQAVFVVPDEPKEKLHPGSSAVSALSRSACTAAAVARDLPVYQHVSELRSGEISKSFKLPLPMVTIIQSGKSALGKLNCVKEFMIVPKPGVHMHTALQQIGNVYNNVVKNLYSKGGITAKNVNDIGALCPQFDRPEQGLDLLQEGINGAGLTPGEDIFIAINCAAHEIFDYEKGKYELFAGQQKIADDVVDFWVELLSRYPSVIALIDPFRKQEQEHWMRLCDQISDRCYIVGSNVYHRPGLLKDETLTEQFKTSGIAFKLEQMNTVSDIIECCKKMEEDDNQIVISASHGESTDNILVELAVGVNARFLKVGGPCRGERVSKLNYLLQIEDILEQAGKLAFHEDYVFPHIAPPPLSEPEEHTEEGLDKSEKK